MAIEFEKKYRATPEKLIAIDKATDGFRCEIRMETTYYDTPEGAMAARRYTLRRRMENDQSVCTLKIPAQGGGRGEFEVCCDRIEDAIPRLCKLSGVEELTGLTADGLVPVCGAKFTRIAKTIELPGCTVELALDQGVLTGGGREIPLWEMEVEHKAGSRELAVAYARILAENFSLTEEHYSKFRRALDLAKGV